MALEPDRPERSIFKDDRWNTPFMETPPAGLRAMADRLLETISITGLNQPMVFS
jgi:hypothetical protein